MRIKRIVGLCLLGLLSYVVVMVVMFPVAPIVDHFRPQLGYVSLQGVDGKLYKGSIDKVSYTDDLLPLEFQNVGWSVTPKSLLKGRAGASLSFDGYGGSGTGQVSVGLSQDIAITDLTFDVQAKELEALLPVPIASFSGQLVGDIKKVVLVNNVLSSMDGLLRWENAELEAPIPTSLGEVSLKVESKDDRSHLITLDSKDGDVGINGSITLNEAGDFNVDVLLTPTSGAGPAVINGLRQMGRADAQGRVRVQRQGNVNRLM